MQNMPMSSPQLSANSIASCLAYCKSACCQTAANIACKHLQCIVCRLAAWSHTALRLAAEGAPPWVSAKLASHLGELCHASHVVVVRLGLWWSCCGLRLRAPRLARLALGQLEHLLEYTARMQTQPAASSRTSRAVLCRRTWWRTASALRRILHHATQLMLGVSPSMCPWSASQCVGARAATARAPGLRRSTQGEACWPVGCVAVS